MSEKTARLISEPLKVRFRGDAALYELNPPLASFDGEKWEHVIVSAAMLFNGEIETYIFPATEDGDVSDWGAMPGSQKGTLSHHKVLEDAGYTVIGG